MTQDRSIPVEPLSPGKVKHARGLRVVCFLLLVAAGLALRISYVFIIDPVLDRDSVLYCEIAEKWHRCGNACTALESRVGNTDPGYFFLLKKGIDWGFPVMLWGRIVCIVASIVFFAAVYGIGRTVFPAYGGELLRLIAILHPIVGRMAMSLLRDPVFLALYAVCFWCILQICLKRSLRWVGLFSLSAAAAFLMRYEALELLPIFFVVTLGLRKGKRDMLFLLKAWCICMLLYIVFCAAFIQMMDIPYGRMLAGPFKKLETVTTPR